MTRSRVSIDTAFEGFNVSGSGDEEDASEITLRTPAPENSRKLDDLARFAKEWNQDLRVFSEVFDPERADATITAIATGSWVFYLSCAPAVVWGLAKCVKGVNQILREVIETQKLIKQLSSKGTPVALVTPLEDHANAKIRADLDVLASQLVDEYYRQNDDGRRAELKVALNQALQRLAKRLSAGEKVDLRLNAPKRPRIDGDRAPTEDEQRQIAKVERLEHMAKEVRASAVDASDTTSADVAHLLPAPEQSDAPTQANGDAA